MNDELEKDEVTNDEVTEGAEDGAPADDLDESIDVIEEEKEFEDTQYDDDDNYIGDDPEVTDENDWATPEATPEGSDIPVTVDLEIMGENMMEEGEAILDVIGPSGNKEFDELVIDKDKQTVSYVDPDDPSVIKQVDADQDEFDGLGYDSSYLEDRVYDDDEAPADNGDGGYVEDYDDELPGGDEPVELGEEDKEY